MIGSPVLLIPEGLLTKLAFTTRMIDMGKKKADKKVAPKAECGSKDAKPADAAACETKPEEKK